MICLRFDLDYVPWDSVNAEKYGHGEPAMILKLLDFARQSGFKFHFFISNRALRTFPTTADAILGEGHDLDWLTSDLQTLEEAKILFSLAGHDIQGLATASPLKVGESLDDIHFLTGPEGAHESNVPYFPAIDFEELSLMFRAERERLSAEGHVAVVTNRPQEMAKLDPSLSRFKNLVRQISESSTPIRTLRDVVKRRDSD